jgi:hypothetical protein
LSWGIDYAAIQSLRAVGSMIIPVIVEVLVVENAWRRFEADRRVIW